MRLNSLKIEVNRKILNISDRDGQFPSSSVEEAGFWFGLALNWFEANQHLLLFSMLLDHLLGVSGDYTLVGEPVEHLFLNVLPIDFHRRILIAGIKRALLVSAAAQTANSAEWESLKVLDDVLGSLEIAARNWKHVMINKMSWKFQYIWALIYSKVKNID